MCLRSDYIIYDALQNYKYKYSPQTYDRRGHVTDLTSDDLHKKFEIYKMCPVPGGLLLSESFIFLLKIVCHWQRYKFAAFCDRAEVYLRCQTSVT